MRSNESCSQTSLEPYHLILQEKPFRGEALLSFATGGSRIAGINPNLSDLFYRGHTES
jgi:hypothetical protein